MKEMLTGIDRALTAQCVGATPQLGKDITFGIYRRGDGKLVMRNKIVQIDESNKTCVYGTVYDVTPGLCVLKHPQTTLWDSHDYQA